MSIWKITISNPSNFVVPVFTVVTYKEKAGPKVAVEFAHALGTEIMGDEAIKCNYSVEEQPAV